MKKLLILPLAAALALVVSCQKQQSEEEKKAEVERLVQERLAAEHLTDEKQRLARLQAELEAREKALLDKEAAAAARVPRSTPIEVSQPVGQPPDISEPRSTASYGTFYQKLEPHGAWSETSDYGYVWQPREAEESRDWRPYTDGRWVFTNAGWTWVSEEAFGWATYHYGRWIRLRRVGWVWVPGEEWAPAWVSWRISREYVGWAPLPPEARFDRRSGIRNWADNYYDIGPDQYAFVLGTEFGSRRLNRSVLPVERNVTIVIGTTNVTNITFTNTTIISLGPNYEEMRSRSQQPIERYRLERQTDSEISAAPTVRGDVLVMSVPAITRVQGVDRPRLKETIAQATVEKNWAANADPASTERAREKMKAEAMPPPNAPSKTFVKPVPSTTVPAGSSPVSVRTVAAPPTPMPTARATPGASATAIVRATAAPASTPAVSGSPRPSATPNRAPQPTPAPTARATPPASATPIAWATAPALATPSVSGSPRPLATPTRAPQPTPRQALPAPGVEPTPRVSFTQPPKSVVKPTPFSAPAPKPLASPRVPQLSPVAPPPVKATAPNVWRRPRSETKPVVRPTPPIVRPKQPAAIPGPPTSRAEPSTPPNDKKAKSKPMKGPGQTEDTQPKPIPTAVPR